MVISIGRIHAHPPGRWGDGIMSSRARTRARARYRCRTKNQERRTKNETTRPPGERWAGQAGVPLECMAENPPPDPAIELKRMELEFEAAEKDKDRQLRKELALMERETAMLKLAEQKGMTIQQLRAKLMDTGAKLKHDADKFQAELVVKERLGSQGNYGLGQ